jgi:hypothetical protein
MRNNPTPKQQLKDDLTVFTLTFGLYLFSYFWGFHSLCILSMALMNMITFQAGISFHEYYCKPIHLNQFDELDNSMDTDEDDSLSLKQREQGATSSTCLTEEQEEKLNEQLQKIVEETSLRNRKRSSLITGRTPSSTTLVEEGEIPPISNSDVDRDDYHDMPALISSDKANPLISKKADSKMVWPGVPNFSQNHYLHNYVDDID